MQVGRTSVRAREGARKVWVDCLRVNSGDKVCVIYDETTTKTARVLIDDGRSFGLDVTERLVPLAHQREFAPTRGLCRDCIAALRGHAGIITCLSDETGTTSYRRELLSEGASGTTKVGHMPGAELFVLEWAVNVDYASATAKCEDLALALALGSNGKLDTSTFDESGNETGRYSLHLDLGGRTRFPVISTGVVPPGAWGNLPGGETFIAPKGASGVIAINGAFKNRVLGSAEALVLRFDRGRICEIDGTRDCVAAFHELIDAAAKEGDPHWNELAELGIGVNQGITELTGNSLFDEKCAGTVHIALGENRGFGGHCESRIHEDLITRKPSLWVDERPILLQGQDVFAPSEWYEDIDSYPVDPMLAEGDPTIGLTPENTSVANGCLRRVHRVGAGRTCVYRIGNETTSPWLLRIYNLVRLVGRTSFSRLCAQLDAHGHLTDQEVRRALSILIRHDVIFLNES